MSEVARGTKSKQRKTDVQVSVETDNFMCQSMKRHDRNLGSCSANCQLSKETFYIIRHINNIGPMSRVYVLHRSHIEQKHPWRLTLKIYRSAKLAITCHAFCQASRIPGLANLEQIRAVRKISIVIIFLIQIEIFILCIQCSNDNKALQPLLL